MTDATAHTADDYARDAESHGHVYDPPVDHAAGSHDDHAHEAHHGPSLRFLTVIFMTLMGLTLLTVGVTAYDFGYQLNLTVALVIAFVKATLVGLYFMHLRWDPPVFGFILVVALGFVTLFIVFTLLDTSEVLPYVEARATAGAAAP